MKKIFLFLTAIICSFSIYSQCPNFNLEQSNAYYLLFTSDTELDLQEVMTINGKTFISSGSWFSNGLYYYSWSNSSGQAIDKENFNLGDTGCQVKDGEVVQPTLSIPRFDFTRIQYYDSIKVYNLSGKYIANDIRYLQPGLYIFTANNITPIKIKI